MFQTLCNILNKSTGKRSRDATRHCFTIGQADDVDAEFRVAKPLRFGVVLGQRLPVGLVRPLRRGLLFGGWRAERQQAENGGDAC